MSKEETYVPLEKSAFWQDMTACAEKYWRTNPTLLHRFELLFFVSGNRHEWDGGILVDICKPGVEINDASLTYRASESVLREDPEDNPLFKLVIPSIAESEFLKDLSGNPDAYSEDKRVNCDRPVSLDEFSAINYMPSCVDVHYLAAAMTILKHVYLHQDRLSKDRHGDEKQSDIIKRALNNGLDIIRERGLENQFTKSCEEFAEKMPQLTTFSKKYIRGQNEEYQTYLALNRDLAAMDEAQLRRMAEFLSPPASPKSGPRRP